MLPHALIAEVLLPEMEVIGVSSLSAEASLANTVLVNGQSGNPSQVVPSRENSGTFTITLANAKLGTPKKGKETSHLSTVEALSLPATNPVEEKASPSHLLSLDLPTRSAVPNLHPESSSDTDSVASDAPLLPPSEPEVGPSSTMVPLPLGMAVLIVVSAVCSGFSMSIISIFINQELKYGAVQVTEFWLFIGLTSWLEPLLGVLPDRVIIGGERRRPLIVLPCLLSSTLYFFLCFKSELLTGNFIAFIAVMSVERLFLIVKHCAVNAVLLEIGKYEGEPRDLHAARVSTITSRVMTWECTGTFLSAIAQTTMLRFFNIYTAIGVNGGCYLVLFVCACALPHKMFVLGPQEEGALSRVWREIQSLHSSGGATTAFRQDLRNYLVVICFAAVYAMTPDAGTPYYNYLYSFNFPSWYYSLLNCIGCVGSTLGSMIFVKWMRRRNKAVSRDKKPASISFFYLVGSLAAAFSYVPNIMLCTGFAETFLHIPVPFFAPIDSFITYLLSILEYIPITLSSTDYSLQGLELTSMQCFNVAVRAGSLVSSSFTLALLHVKLHDSMWRLIVLCMFFKLLVIPFAYLLPTSHHCPDTEVVTFIRPQGEVGEVEEENLPTVLA